MGEKRKTKAAGVRKTTTAILTAAGFVLGGLIMPSLTEWGSRIKDSWFEPRVEVRINSILLTNTKSDELVNVKIGFTAANHDDVERSIIVDSLLNLSNTLSAIIENKRLRVGAGDEVRDSIEFLSNDLADLFTKLPEIGGNRWQLSYHIVGSDDLSCFVADTSHISKLVYYLTPADSFFLPVQEAERMGHMSLTIKDHHPEELQDSTDEGVFIDMSLYPVEHLQVRIGDSNNEMVLTGEELLAPPAIESVMGSTLHVTLGYNPEVYSNRVGGFILHIETPCQFGDSALFNLMGGAELELMFKSFRAHVDSDILFCEQFIYVRFD